MSAFVVGTSAPEGLDSKVYRVRIIVDRVDGGELTSEDVARIEAAYAGEPVAAGKSRAKTPTRPAARKSKATRKAGRAA